MEEEGRMSISTKEKTLKYYLTTKKMTEAKIKPKLKGTKKKSKRKLKVEMELNDIITWKPWEEKSHKLWSKT